MTTLEYIGAGIGVGLALNLIVSTWNALQKNAKREGVDEAFKQQLAQWHGANGERIGRIEMALGLHNPNETAFPRRSEFDEERRRVWEQFDEHDQRIRGVEHK